MIFLEALNSVWIGGFYNFFYPKIFSKHKIINSKIDVNFNFFDLYNELAIIKSKTESIEYAIGLLLSDAQKEKVDKVSKFYLLSNLVLLNEQASDFDKTSVEYIKLKTELELLDAELTAKGLLEPNVEL